METLLSRQKAGPQTYGGPQKWPQGVAEVFSVFHQTLGFSEVVHLP